MPHPNMGRVRAGDRAEYKPSTRDLEWAAGFYEGEGTINLGDDSSFQLSLHQNNPEPLVRLHKMFGGRKPFIYRPAAGNRKDCWRWYVSGTRARGIALTLFCLLSARRRLQIYKAFTGPATVWSLKDGICQKIERWKTDNSLLRYSGF